MQKALVAGGAGFLGSHLCRRLLKDGFDVVCVDNLITGNKLNIEDLLDNPKFLFLNFDITLDLSTVAERVGGEIQYIFHLASPASPNKQSLRSYINLPIETMMANSSGTQNLLRIGKQMNSRFLYASTSEVYGNPKVSPQPESYFGNVNPNGVRSVYDEAKRFGEAMCFAYLRKFDVDARIIRIFNTYGPNMQKDDGRVVSNFINQAIENLPITVYGEGSQTRSFCYVDDMTDGILSAMMTKGTKGEVINLGNPDERSINDFAKIILELTGSKSKLVHEERPLDDPDRRRPDITKAQELLGWKINYKLEEGLKKTIEYFRSL